MATGFKVRVTPKMRAAGRANGKKARGSHWGSGKSHASKRKTSR